MKTKSLVFAVAIFACIVLSGFQNQPFNLQQTPINFQTAPINFSGGNSTIIKGLGNKPIVVWGVMLSTSAATTLTFDDGGTVATGLVPMTGPITLSSGGSINWNPSNVPMLATANGHALALAQSGTAAVGGFVIYSQ